MQKVLQHVLSSLSCLFILGCSTFLLIRSSIFPFEGPFCLLHKYRICVRNLWLEDKVLCKLKSLCLCFSLYWALTYIFWLVLAKCSSDGWYWFWVWIVFLSVPIVQCIEVYTEKKHEYDIVDITYSCGKIVEQTQLTLKELWDSSYLYASTHPLLFQNHL